jgi:hypothetical protein
MPSYSEVLTGTYLPAQASKLMWDSAKAVAGAQFDALAESRKAVDDVRLRRQQYADNIRPREGNDAFLMSSLSAGLQLQGGGGGAAKLPEAYQAGLDAAARMPQGAKPGSSEYQDAVKGLKAPGITVEQHQKLAAAISAKTQENAAIKYPAPAGLKTEAEISKERGAAASKSKQQGVTVQEMRELADSLGGRAFQGGEEARLYYKNLSPEDQEALTLYQNALLDDGVVTPEEIPEDQLQRGAEMYKQAAAKGAYRRQDRGAYDEGYLDLLKDLAAKEGALKKEEARLAGKTKETFAEELYTGATQRAAIPPLLRSLEPEMKSFLDGYTSALTSDPKTNAEAYLNSQLSDRERKGFSAASAMAASGMRAADIMDNLQALSPEERRKVMGALASRDAIASTQMKVAPGTPLPEIEKINTEDRRAQEAELLRTETRLQKRLREIDASLAEGRQSGFGGIVSPDTAARPRREVLMAALSPEEVKAAERAADEAEVERIAAERDRADARTAAFKRTADADMLETPEEVAAVEEFRRRQASGQGMGLTREQLLANISEEPRMEFERRRLQAQEDGKSSPVPMDLPATPQGRAFTPVDLAEPAPAGPVPAPAPEPEKVYRKVYNQATGKIELIEVK